MSMQGKLESAYPLALSFIGTCVWIAAFRTRYTALDTGALFQTAITVASITIGFLTTAKSVLVSTNSKLLSDMRRQGSYEKFVRYITRASMASFYLVAISAACLCMGWSQVDRWHTIFFVAWFFGVLYAGLTSFRSVNLFCLFIELDARPKSEQGRG